MSDNLRLAIGIPFFALMFFHLCLRAYLGGVAPLEYSRRGWDAEWREGRTVITVVGEGAPATGVVRDGDEVVAFWSERPDSTPLVTPDFWRVPPGTRYMLIVRRSGQVLGLPLHTIRIGAGAPLFGLFILTFLLFLVAGVAVFPLKPGNDQAWLLALMLTSFTALLPLSVYIKLPQWVNLTASLAQVLSTIFLPIILHFFLIFPERSPLLGRFPKLERLIYLPYLFFLLPLYGLRAFLLAFQLTPSWRGLVMRLAGSSIAGVAVAYMLAGLVAMVINYRAVSPAARRKLRVVMVGCGAGFVNIVLMPFGELVGLNRALPMLWKWLDMGLLFTMPLIPLSFAYAIVRRQVIPIRLIIRRGARYVLVSRGSIILGFVIVGLILTVLLSTVFNRLHPPPVVNGVVSAIVCIIAYNGFRSLHRRYLAPVIDRRFFRQAYDTRQIIVDLTESLRTTTSLDHLLELVATQVQAALHSENVTIFLRDEATGDYLSAYSCDYNEAEGRVIYREGQYLLPSNAEVVKRLSDNGKSLEVEEYIAIRRQESDNEIVTDVEKAWSTLVDGEGEATEKKEEIEGGGISTDSPISPKSEITEDEMEVLRKLKSKLLLPLSLRGATLGIVSLGPRPGDLSYSREDEGLLMSVAGQATFAIENALLVEQMIVEAGLRQELEAENEIRAKELEEARQLQLSMLPRTIPQLPHLEVAAYMKPAAEVGGDYYDFHLSDDGVLTVAIGDATGHGLKAGTVVTATKSLFNHLAQESNIPTILRQSSHALKRMNLRSLFMTMTIAKVKGYQLTLGSAGMPPVLIYRAAQRVVEEVSLNGAPLGSLTTYSYGERSLDLVPGDVVVLMSDGYPERFNGNNEMLDYENAKSILLEIAILPPKEIIDIFVKIGDKWAGGRPQDDDVTFVVLKLR